MYQFNVINTACSIILSATNSTIFATISNAPLAIFGVASYRLNPTTLISVLANLTSCPAQSDIVGSTESEC